MDLKYSSLKYKSLIRCSVTAITSRSHRGDRGSTPRFGDKFFFLQNQIKDMKKVH